MSAREFRQLTVTKPSKCLIYNNMSKNTNEIVEKSARQKHKQKPSMNHKTCKVLIRYKNL